MIKQSACMLILLSRVLSAGVEQWAVSFRGLDVPFRSWEAEGAGADTGVHVLVPAAATTNKLLPTGNDTQII